MNLPFDNLPKPKKHTVKSELFFAVLLILSAITMIVREANDLHALYIMLSMALVGLVVGWIARGYST